MKLLDKMKANKKKRIEKDFNNYVEKLKKENKLNTKDLVVMSYSANKTIGKMFYIICALVIVLIIL